MYSSLIAFYNVCNAYTFNSSQTLDLYLLFPLLQHPSSLINFSSVFGCSGGFHSDISGKVVAVARGNCTFFEKAANIQEHGGVAALIVDYSNETFHVSCIDGQTC